MNIVFKNIKMEEKKSICYELNIHSKLIMYNSFIGREFELH